MRARVRDGQTMMESLQSLEDIESMKDKMWEFTPDAGMWRVGFFPDQVVRKMSLCRHRFTRCIRHTRPSRPSLPAAFSVAAELSQRDGLQGVSISNGCLASGRDGHAMEVEVQAAGKHCAKGWWAGAKAKRTG